MEALLQTPPRTIMEVFQMLPEGTLAELIDNVIYMPPSPTPEHQITSMDLGSSIHAFTKTNNVGQTISAPIDVYLDETSNAVQPDIVVVLKDQMDIIQKKNIRGVPAILIEILSEGNKDHDLIRKKDLYERFGVQEYHVVDTATKLVMGFSLTNGSYQKVYELIGTLRSLLLQQEFPF